MPEKKKQGVSFNDIIFETGKIAKDVEVSVDDLDEPIICDLKYLSQSTLNSIRKKCKLWGEDDKKFMDKAVEVSKKSAIKSLAKWDFTPRMLNQLAPISIDGLSEEHWDEPFEITKSTLDGIFKLAPQIASAISITAQKGSTFDKTDYELAKN